MSQPYHHGALRTALLEAAETVLERDGITALTLRAAARQAGVSHAAPTHHFGDLTGLLTELAAQGFTRFRKHMKETVESCDQEPKARLVALGHSYVGFARAYPGLFQLMFRSERLDWTSPTLYTAGTSAFAMLTQYDNAPAVKSHADDLQSLIRATTGFRSCMGLQHYLLTDDSNRFRKRSRARALILLLTRF